MPDAIDPSGFQCSRTVSGPTQSVSVSWSRRASDAVDLRVGPDAVGPCEAEREGFRRRRSVSGGLGPDAVGPCRARRRQSGGAGGLPTLSIRVGPDAFGPCEAEREGFRRRRSVSGSDALVFPKQPPNRGHAAAASLIERATDTSRYDVACVSSIMMNQRASAVCYWARLTLCETRIRINRPR